MHGLALSPLNSAYFMSDMCPFINLSTVDNLQWNWYEVKREIDLLFESYENKTEIFKDLCFKAKLSGDHLRKSTKNKIYTAPWSGRIADMFCNLKRSFDLPSTQEAITKSFCKYCDTEMPVSKGITFDDEYLDENWNILPKSCIIFIYDNSGMKAS